jgi:hypothetical protein
VRSVDWIFIVGVAGVAVTGPIRDIGQNLLLPAFQAGSNSGSNEMGRACGAYGGG